LSYLFHFTQVIFGGKSWVVKDRMSKKKKKEKEEGNTTMGMSAG
jgi:hypothetical protein